MTDPLSKPDAASPPVQQTVVEFLPSDEYSQYLLTSKAEKLGVCRGLAEHVSQVSMIFNEGRDMVLTSLISWDGGGLLFDLGASMEMNRKALKAEKLFCSAQLEKVEIQFILRGVAMVEVDGRQVFRAAWPDSILRLQRRDYFRLVTPIARPLICKIQLGSAAGEKATLNAHVTDISIGGVCLTGHSPDLPLETGMEFPGCSIDLPEVGTIIATLCLRWQTDTITRSGIRGKRAGFEFANLPAAKTTLIQRYIIKTERERKARESGTA